MGALHRQHGFLDLDCRIGEKPKVVFLKKIDVVHAFNPNTPEVKASRFCEFKASLVY